MSISIGDKFPSVTFKEKTSDGIKDISSDELLKGKKLVLVAVPGAFTPTCSLNHLPGFIENRDAFISRGVDEIAVMAVNDPHVMGAWAKHSGGEGKIRFLADGNGDVTRKIGMDIDLSGGGMGVRGKRYSMLIEDGIVTQLNVEDSPGQAETSGAATLLGQL